MPFDLPANETHGFWVDLYVPAETPPGEYRGVYRVTAEGGKSLDVPVTLTVWNFTLPPTPTLVTAFGRRPADARLLSPAGQGEQRAGALGLARDRDAMCPIAQRAPLQCYAASASCFARWCRAMARFGFLRSRCRHCGSSWTATMSMLSTFRTRRASSRTRWPSGTSCGPGWRRSIGRPRSLIDPRLSSTSI